MADIVIVIKWLYATETIIISDSIASGQILTTYERWEYLTDAPLVSYLAQVEAIDHRRSTNTLRLRYKREIQTDIRLRDHSSDLTWGVSLIKWDSSGLTASAEWLDEDDPNRSGPAKKATVLSGDSPVEGRVKANVSVIARPKQSALREALLVLDRQSCTLTGEKEAAALDAAHIVPVRANGAENVKNAILLRTDLHRLFDAGLFWFELSGKEAVVKYLPVLSDRYQELLTGAKLPDSTFERVELALRDREKLPDGKGGATRRVNK